MTSDIGVPAALTRHLGWLEDALKAGLPPHDDLARAARYAMGWGDGDVGGGHGKRIRPSLALLAAECVGPDPGLALPGAIAIEFAHNFSLVHDDIQDRDIERHGQPTVWHRYGEAQAINVGDYLFARAIETLALASGPADGRIAATGALLTAIARMLRGQWTDIVFETAGSVGETSYLDMVADKTGALLGASLQTGALLGGAPQQVADALRAWGEGLGVAFQVWDDYLGIWGNPDETGKSNASDIARKKRSLPIVLALQSDGPAAAAVASEYARESPDIEAVVEALERAGIRDRVVHAANARAQQSIDAVAALPVDGRARSELTEVARFLVQRSR